MHGGLTPRLTKIHVPKPLMGRPKGFSMERNSAGLADGVSGRTAGREGDNVGGGPRCRQHRLTRAGASAVGQPNGPRPCRPLFYLDGSPSAFCGSEKEEMTRRTRPPGWRPATMSSPLFYVEKPCCALSIEAKDKPCTYAKAGRNRSVPPRLRVLSGILG